jgi:hypothetical protein
MTINITPSDILPGRMTPYEAFYRRLPPYWEDYSRQEHQKRAVAADNTLPIVEDEDKIYELSDDEVATKNDQEFITISEKRLAANYIEITDRIVKKRDGPL